MVVRIKWEKRRAMCSGKWAECGAAELDMKRLRERKEAVVLEPPAWGWSTCHVPDFRQKPQLPSHLGVVVG